VIGVRKAVGFRVDFAIEVADIHLAMVDIPRILWRISALQQAKSNRNELGIGLKFKEEMAL
jgi:hypothetical protein